MNPNKCTAARRHVWTKWTDPIEVVRVKSLGHFDYKTNDYVQVQVRECIHCVYQQARDIFHGKVTPRISSSA